MPSNFRIRPIADLRLKCPNLAMHHIRLFFLLALAATAREATAEPLEQPIVQTTIHVEREQGGSCSELHAGKPSAAPVLNMTDICHGWSTTTCADKLLVRGVGVTEDQAQVLFTNDNRAIDLVRLVDQGVRTRWSRHEHLRLTFGTPRCEGSTVVLPLSGSHIRVNTTGSASGFAGTLRIRSGQDQQITIGQERQANVR
jgi:hypothetical protein